MELLAVSLAASAALDHPITVGMVLGWGLVVGGIFVVLCIAVYVLNAIGDAWRH